MMKPIFLTVLLSFGIAGILVAQPTVDPKIKTSSGIMNGFMDLRFGMFIHWGPVALRGTEIGWSRGVQVPAGEYDSLYMEFNPLLFDADRWVKTAKDAGMKYIVITAKHHDGFCLWPTAFTGHHIM
jgi:alpha-L-fucosidase